MRRGGLSGVSWLVFAMGAIAAGGGCQLFMNLDVSGYDAAPTASSDAGGCGSDAACFSIGCVSSRDCDGGSICCMTIAPSVPLSAIAACQPAAPCGSTGIQLCKSSDECGSSGSCSPCTFSGASLSVCDSTFTSFACSP